MLHSVNRSIFATITTCLLVTATVSGAASANAVTTQQGITGAIAPAAVGSVLVGGATDINVERVAGVDRYKTAAIISAKAYPTTAEVVYVASGTNFPDAVSAAPAAVHENAPLLLTQPGELPASTRAEIVRLDPEKIVVIGGSGVVSNAVRDALKSLAPSVVRVAGIDRYATSIALARYAFRASGASTAYIATGNAFPDALSAGAAAGSIDGPVILVNGSASTADSATRSLLSDLRVSTVKVVGGTVAVSAGIATSLGGGGKTVTRLSGSDRFATSVATNANAFKSSPTVYLATGYNYPDALAGSVLAGAQPAPMFVVPTTCVPSGVLSQLDAVGATDVVLLGGTTVLQTGVANLQICEVAPVKVVTAVAPAPQPTGTVSSLLKTYGNDTITSSLNDVGMDRLWHREQEPAVNGVVQTDRIRVVSTAPGSGTYKPTGKAIRFENRSYAGGSGDVTDTSGYLASRSEVFGRQANPTSTPNSQWPDPEGSTRWYGFPVYLSSPWEFATDSKWMIVTQWKGRSSGSPAIELGIEKGQWRIGGTGGTTTMGPAKSGVWTYMEVGIHFSADAKAGWVEAWMNGQQVIPKTARATMNLSGGTADPSYLKQGIYRTKAWTSTHVMYLGSTKIGTTKTSVAP